jgi:hypothetical protein
MMRARLKAPVLGVGSLERGNLAGARGLGLERYNDVKAMSKSRSPHPWPRNYSNTWKAAGESTMLASSCGGMHLRWWGPALVE